MAESTPCPPPQLLLDFGRGKLDSAKTLALQQHLETCVDCRYILGNMSDDPLPGQSGQPQAPAGRQATQVGGFSGSASVAGKSVASLSSAGHAAGNPSACNPSPSAAAVPPELADHPDYEIVRELGQGGMGVVYLARNRMMDRLEVLKVVSRSLLDRPGAMERFQQEIRSAAKLSHPNIVAAYSVIRPGNLLVLCMEYVEGQDLGQTVKQRGPLPVVNASFYIHQVALGLQHAHDKGMVHRDIKPGNLMLAVVNKKHVVKILDFGLAKATSEKLADGGLTKSGQMLGTPDYIAPEQTLDAQKADIRADIYSLGCTLYYLLSGRPPFDGASLYEILHAHHEVEARALNLVRPEVPLELATVVAKMMAKEPAKRFQTPLEVAKALNPFFKVGAQPAKADHSLPPQSAPSIPPQPQMSLPGQSGPIPVPLARAVPLAAPQHQPVPAAAPGLADLDMMASASPSKPKGKPETQSDSGRWKTPVILVAAGLAGMLLLAAVMFKVRTRDGILAITVNEPNPQVAIDGEQVTVSWDDGGKQAEISVPAGSHKIELKKDGFKIIGERVEIERAGRLFLSAKLEPLPKPEQQSVAVTSNEPASGKRELASESTSPHSPTSTNEALGSRVVEHGRPPLAESTNAAGSNVVVYSNGQWHVEKNELLQEDVKKGRKAIIFGDSSWTDYDFSFQAKSEGEEGFAGLVQAANTSTFRSFNAGGYHNRGRELAARFEEKWSRGPGLYLAGGIELDRWHDVRIEVRGPNVTCSLNGQKLFSERDDRFLKGCVGFITYQSTKARFRNIVVTAPGGAVLWRGMPELPRMSTDDVPQSSGTENARAPAPSSPIASAMKPAVAPPPAIAPFDAKQARAHQEAWAGRLGIPVEQTNSIGMKLVLIPPGEFMMGSPAGEARRGDEYPQHRVRITRPFYLSVTEVTQRQWQTLMETVPWRGQAAAQDGADYPATYVNWHEAAEFCRRLSSQVRIYRLPTEAEWEYACRAGTQETYSFGADASRLPDYEWCGANAADVGEKYAHRVGQKRKNPFGLFDMHGNVWEWCADWYDSKYYANSSVDDPTGPATGPGRTIRGGGWLSGPPGCRSADRSNKTPNLRNSMWGFRVVISADPQPIAEVVVPQTVDMKFDADGDGKLDANERREALNAFDVDHDGKLDQKEARAYAAAAAAMRPRAPSGGSIDNREFARLFNGRDLSGWKSHPGDSGNWWVEDGLLTGSAKGFSTLFSERDNYENFHLKAKVRLAAGGNGGLCFRSQFSAARVPTGFEAEIVDPASVRNGRGTGTLIMATPELDYLASAKAGPGPGNWFEIEVIALEKRLTVLVGGRKVSEANIMGTQLIRGHIAVQCNKGPVQFESIEIAELPNNGEANAE